MFRARKPSLKRSQPDDTPRKRARLASPAAKASPLPPATPVAKPSSHVRGTKMTLRSASKSRLKKQSRISFPTSKSKKKVIGKTAPSSSTSKTLSALASKEPTALKDNQERDAAGAVEVSPLAKIVTPLPTGKRTERAVTKKVDVQANVGVSASQSSRKRLDFGTEPVDGEPGASIDNSEVDGFQSDSLPSASALWPPYAPEKEELCRAHDHRLIKPEDDPILDAALELLS